MPIPFFSLRLLTCLLVLGCAGCASTAIDDAERLSQDGRFEDALRELDSALRSRPDDTVLRSAHRRQRDRVLVHATAQAELALAAGRVDEAQSLLDRARAFGPQEPRVLNLAQQVERARRASAALAATASAATAAPTQAADTPSASLSLGPAFQKPITLEFRDAPLRQVFEALARSSAVNFVFDKDVRGDARVTVFLRAVTLDEAMRVILSTQQLDRKLLNDNTVLIYPNTAPKQREHQELQTRVLYLVNADPKQVLTLVRTMTKTRDLFVDERLNALVVRDTPEVVRQIEQLIAAIDLAEPEVVMAVEVLEVASDRLTELGLGWPTSLSLGIPVAGATVNINSTGFRGLVANPAISAQLRGASGNTNLLANPTIRARNREKAKVQIGEKLPVFTATAATLNVAGSTAVNYLDVGLKLDVEPSVQLDGEVIIKVALEVSNLLREVSGPNASLAYQVGTRMTTTSLRLKDGQTQVLAGLINDQDRRAATGLPGLSQLPLLGRLFGVQRDERNKTEIVMLITPHIVRNLAVLDTRATTLSSGTDTLPGATPLRLGPAARVGVGAGRGSGLPGAAAAAADGPARAAGALQLAASAEARVGETMAVTLSNRSGQRATGELLYDAAQLQPASVAPPGAAPGRWPFVLEPQAEAVLILRVLPAAAGQRLSVQASADLAVEGEVVVMVPAVAAPSPATPGALR